ncbi:MAG TPA: arylesterase [Bacteroidetes bacterium]|nr:arylesterase [Bacteroidota bacterium]
MNFKIINLFLLAFIFVACGNEQAKQGTNKASKNTAPTEQKAKTKKEKTILFFGNSLTAAYGLDPSKGFVSLIQQRLDSLGLPYRAVNAGLSGETTAGGKERLAWVLRQPVDIFVLELGGNDGLRGIEPASSFENLDAIITAVKTKYPQAKIILAGMEAPPNMGERFTSQFREMYPKLAKKHGTALIPFFLENIAGIPELNQKDRVHPNEKGQLILVENVWRVLGGLLEEG